MTDSFHFVRYDKAYPMLVKLNTLKIDQSSLIEINANNYNKTFK